MSPLIKHVGSPSDSCDQCFGHGMSGMAGADANEGCVQEKRPSR